MFNTSLRYNFDSRQGVRPNQQTPIRQGGFGGHFKDAPPPWSEDKEDNKIERKKKPQVKKVKTKRKNKNKLSNKE